MTPNTPTIALVAGEASGDQLGAALIRELRDHYPGASFIGIGGQSMKAAGLEAWWDCQELALFGLFEVLSHLPRLISIRRQLRKRLLEAKPDIFIGIDAPDFNLRLEAQLKSAGIRTAHYVSPTIWAWREKRVKKIARAADLVLCLFPFEPDFYRGHGVDAVYVGHPMADQVPLESEKAAARSALGIDPARQVIALLPGSRIGEVSRLAQPMLEAAAILAAEEPGLDFVAAMANPGVRAQFESRLGEGQYPTVRIVDHRAREVIAAADLVLCASGTATLEIMLVNRPMVVAYRIAESTYQLAKATKMVSARLFALPNILAEQELVPELLQHEATGQRMAQEATRWLQDEDRRSTLETRFNELHEKLRCNASEQAGLAVVKLLKRTE
jgi:lipid-A-disaccharide synthase